MTIIDIRNYSIKSEDKFILDSNIWVYLFDKTCTPEIWISNSINVYTNFYKNLLNSGSKIYLVAFNTQELSKKFINNDFNAYKAQFPEADFKRDYRPSNYYPLLLEHIRSVHNAILQVATLSNDVFEEFQPEKFFNKDIDFVDEYLCYVAHKLNCKIITHDKDFKNSPYDVDILTDNRKMLVHQ